MRENRWLVVIVALAFVASGLALAGCGSESAAPSQTLQFSSFSSPVRMAAMARRVMTLPPFAAFDCKRLQRLRLYADGDYVQSTDSIRQVFDLRMRASGCFIPPYRPPAPKREGGGR